MMRNPLVVATIFSALVGLGTIPASPARAHEPAIEFLEALRENHYYDMAAIYLERMSNSPLARVDLKEVLDYERGVTLVKASQQQRDMPIREKQLDEAQAAFQAFLTQRPNHKLADLAKSELGNLLVERARVKLEQGKKANKQQRMTEAKALYDEAFTIFGKLVEDIKGKLAKLPRVIDDKDEVQKELIERLRRDYLHVQLLEAAVREESTDAVVEGSEDYKKLLTEAEKLYAAIYEKYRTMIAGLYARMYQGRATQKLGNAKDAISFYVELLEQPDNPDAFRDVKTKTLKLAVISWRQEGQYAEAIRQLSDWIGKARPNETRGADYMELRMSLAQLNIDYVNKLKAANPKDAQIAPLLKEAKALVQFVARYPNDLQKDARKKLAEIGGGPEVADERPDPKTFEEAKVAGREAIGTLQTADQITKVLPTRLKSETDETIKAELQKQMDEATKTLVSARSDALQYFQTALKLANQETETEDLNLVRYFLSYLYHTQQDYYDSAVLAEFVARRSPLSSTARPCAKIAMVSYLKIYSLPGNKDKSFESERIIGICDYIAKQWSDQPEAIDALNTLIPFMITNGELDRAMAYLKDIPENAPQRGVAELKTGQALWANFITGSQELRGWKAEPATAPAGTDLAARQAELNDVKKRAETTLADGIGRMQKDGVADDTTATAVLSLAQIYVDTEQSAKAIPLLEDPKIGALTLVKAKHPSTTKPGFASETYKTGLRAYIASLATPGVKSDDMIKKASEMMDGLKASVGDSGSQQLVAIYLSLAKDLEEQMKLIDNPAAKTAMSKGFETFLTRVGAQSNEFNVLWWVADTFRGMAEAFNDRPGTVSGEAESYYAKSIEAYRAILQRAQSQPGWLPSPQYKLQLQLKIAEINRRLAKYPEAIDALVEILKDNRNALSVQIEAAETFQEMASDPRAKPKTFELALSGSRKDVKTGENLVWGWLKLTKMTANKEQFKDAFHESRLNMARCYYEYSQRSENPAEKSDLLNRAKRTVEFTVKLYPDMGGERWQPQYDQLARQIQGKMGEKVVGVVAFQSPPPASGG